MNRKNALILGVSSGFGKATAIELSKRGYNIFGVHLDLGSTRLRAEEFRNELEAKGIKAVFYNLNAADSSNIANTVEQIKQEFLKSEEKQALGVILHSIAFGSLGPLIHIDKDKQINQKKLEMSINVMANSLIYWIQEIFHADLLAENSRIFAMSSNGSVRATNQYGPVSIAKASLEAIIRQLAFELAQYKITANTILAGPAETPASSKIPDFEKMLKFAREHSPYQRNTIPDDAAKVIAMLSGEESSWITGQVINVDGGQSLFTYLPEYYS
jgi:enoyl-[acyl-carrier-protein] reductase (NADH)